MNITSSWMLPMQHVGMATNQVPWIGSCSCGWKSRDQPNQTLAIAVANTHVRISEGAP